MGIIQRQSIKNSIVSYAGVLIALFSTLYIYKVDEEIYGFTIYLYSTALFLAPFASLGIVASVIKFYPLFSDKKESYFNTLLVLLILANIVFLIAFFVFREPIFLLLYQIGIDPNNLLREYVWIIIPLSFIINLNILFIGQAANLLRIVVPEIISNLGYKIALPIIVFAGYKGFIDKSEIAISILMFFIFVSLMLCAYVWKMGGVGFSKGFVPAQSSELRSEVAKFSLFSGLNNIGSALAFRIDIIMISTMIGWEAAGIYAIIVFLSNVIEIPRKAISRIAAPIINKAWSENDMTEIKTIYQKSSINLLLIGILISLSIWFSLPFLDTISSGADRFVIYRSVFLFLALGKLFELLTSVNGEIIGYSKAYKYNLAFLLILGSVNVVLNLLLIKEYGILGAAIATACSYFLFNLFKLVFISINYKMIPFTGKTLLLLAIGAIVFGLVTILPLPESFVLTPIIKVLILCLLYVPMVLMLNISPDINNILKNILGKIRNIR